MKRPSTPETEFMFCLLQSADETDTVRSRLESIGDGDPNWDEILHLISQHGLHFVFRAVLNDTAINPPERITRTLDEQYWQNSIGNLEYSRQLHELSDLFESKGIAALPYKGPVLAAVAYDGVGNRWFGDLDFLVAKSDVKAACDLLERHGYERINFADIPVETLVDGVVFRWGQEFRFVHPNTGLPVELRFGFIGENSTDPAIIDDLWNRRVSTTFAGRTVSALSPEDRALLLLVHGTKHGWRQLTWVYDVALILQQDINWETVLTRAEQYGWRNAVLYGLAVVSELTTLPVPEPIRPAMDSTRLCSWGARWTASRLRSAPDEELLYLEPITTAMLLNDDFHDMFLEGADELLAPRKADYELISLPSTLHPFYYAVRAYRLGAAKSRSLLRSFRRS